MPQAGSRLDYISCSLRSTANGVSAAAAARASDYPFDSSLQGYQRRQGRDPKAGPDLIEVNLTARMRISLDDVKWSEAGTRVKTPRQQ